MSTDGKTSSPSGGLSPSEEKIELGTLAAVRAVRENADLRRNLETAVGLVAISIVDEQTTDRRRVQWANNALQNLASVTDRVLWLAASNPDFQRLLEKADDQLLKDVARKLCERLIETTPRTL